MASQFTYAQGAKSPTQPTPPRPPAPLYSPTYAPTLLYRDPPTQYVVAPYDPTLQYRTPQPQYVVAQPASGRPRIRVPSAREYVEPDLFFLLAGVSCAQCHSMSEYDRLRAIVSFYNPGALPDVALPRGYAPTVADLGLDAEALAAYRLIMGKYAEFCQGAGARGAHAPGRALDSMGLTCAQWAAYSPSDRLVRLVNYANLGRTPSTPGAMDALAAYAEEMTAYCGGDAIAPSGQVPVGITDQAKFWRGATVVATGVAVVLAWKLSRAGARIRRGAKPAATGKGK